MKKILGMICMLVFTLSIYSQTPNKVSIDLNSLPPEAKSAIESHLALQEAQLQQEVQIAQIETYAKWAGKGKEIGTAVSEGLNAVKDVTLELAESDVGKVTIWLIAWKVAGKDFAQIGIGLILLIVSSIVIIRSYVRTFKRKILVKGGWRQEKEWKVLDYSDSFWEYPNAAAVTHWLAWLVMIGASCIVMFA